MPCLLEMRCNSLCLWPWRGWRRGWGCSWTLAASGTPAWWRGWLRTDWLWSGWKRCRGWNWSCSHFFPWRLEQILLKTTPPKLDFHKTLSVAVWVLPQGGATVSSVTVQSGWNHRLLLHETVMSVFSHEQLQSRKRRLTMTCWGSRWCRASTRRAAAAQNWTWERLQILEIKIACKKLGQKKRLRLLSQLLFCFLFSTTVSASGLQGLATIKRKQIGSFYGAIL